MKKGCAVAGLRIAWCMHALCPTTHAPYRLQSSYSFCCTCSGMIDPADVTAVRSVCRGWRSAASQLVMSATPSAVSSAVNIGAAAFAGSLNSLDLVRVSDQLAPWSMHRLAQAFTAVTHLRLRLHYCA